MGSIQRRRNRPLKAALAPDAQWLRCTLAVTFVEHPLKTLRACREGVSKKPPDEAEYELPHTD
jgi:hypothetical protein